MIHEWSFASKSLSVQEPGLRPGCVLLSVLDRFYWRVPVGLWGSSERSAGALTKTWQGTWQERRPDFRSGRLLRQPRGSRGSHAVDDTYFSPFRSGPCRQSLSTRKSGNSPVDFRWEVMRLSRVSAGESLYTI